MGGTGNGVLKGNLTETYTKEKHFWIEMKKENIQDTLSAGKNACQMNQLSTSYISTVNPNPLGEFRFLPL